MINFDPQLSSSTTIQLDSFTREAGSDYVQRTQSLSECCLNVV